MFKKRKKIVDKKFSTLISNLWTSWSCGKPVWQQLDQLQGTNWRKLNAKNHRWSNIKN